MVNRRVGLMALAAAALAVLATASPATAAPGRGDKIPPAVSHVSAKTKPPAGYVQVASPAFTDPSGLQASGSVACPGQKVPLGGGVTIASNDVLANINSSYPSAHSWVVDVNNGTASDFGFTVYAVCANKPKGYQVVHSATDTDAAGTQAEGFVTCPGAKVPWGGGVYSNSGNVGANINSSYPTGDTSHVWNAFMNNNTATDTGFVVFAECAAKTRIYGQSFTEGTSNPSSEDSAIGTCVTGSVATGGGAFSSSSSVFVNLNSTEPFGKTQWRTWTNNDTGNTYSFAAYAVCVGL